MTTNNSRVWLITGSAAGFGRAIARAALARGQQVVATARRPEALEDLVSDAPDQVLALPDVTRPETGREAIAQTLDRFGRLDVLVNNAGYGTVGAVEEIDPSDLRTVMETMFFGPVALTQAALPHMRAQGSGAIVQMSSMGGQVTAPGFGAYCAAKFALEAISESLAAEETRQSGVGDPRCTGCAAATATTRARRRRRQPDRHGARAPPCRPHHLAVGQPRRQLAP